MNIQARRTISHLSAWILASASLIVLSNCGGGAKVTAGPKCTQYAYAYDITGRLTSSTFPFLRPSSFSATNEESRPIGAG